MRPIQRIEIVFPQLPEVLPVWQGISGTLKAIQERLKKTVTHQELAQAMADLAAQLNKALAEILQAVQNADNVPQAVIDQLTAAKEVAQKLDDINPDQP